MKPRERKLFFPEHSNLATFQIKKRQTKADLKKELDAHDEAFQVKTSQEQGIECFKSFAKSMHDLVKEGLLAKLNK